MPSLYRKYRPQNLQEIVGQAHIKRTLQNAIQQNCLAQTYFFAGPRGTGKTSTARIIARALNCEKLQTAGDPCNTCEPCQNALTGRLIDLCEIDAASNRGIDEIRDLKEKIAFQPTQARTKIYIIDEVHMLTKEAFNALLKTLEEPPSYAHFILATTEPHRVPATIVSRCQRFDFRQITEKEIAAHLQLIAQKEKIQAELPVFDLLAKQVQGGLRDALGLLEQLGTSGQITLIAATESLGLTQPGTVTDFVTSLQKQQLNVALALINGLVEDGVNLTQFTKAVLAQLRELLLTAAQKNSPATTKKLLQNIASLTQALADLKTAVIPQFPLEIAAIKICGAQPDLTPAKESSPKIPPRKPAPQAPTPPPPKSPPAAKPKTTLKIATATLTKTWAEIVPQLKNPTLKLALRDSTITAEANSILVTINSQILFEKINTTETKSHLIETLTQALQQPVQLKLQHSAAAPVAKPELKPSAKPAASLAEAAATLF